MYFYLRAFHVKEIVFSIRNELAFFDNNFEHVRDLQSAHSCVFPLLNTSDMFSRANFILMVFLPAFCISACDGGDLFSNEIHLVTDRKEYPSCGP